MELVLGSIVLRGLVVIVLGLCGELWLVVVVGAGQPWPGAGGKVVQGSELGISWGGSPGLCAHGEALWALLSMWS